MRKTGLGIAAILFLFCFCVLCFAQDEFSEKSLEELLNTPISVASFERTTTREAPGIVTLVTANEIEKSGARDLIDVLRLVPGFDFESDVWGTVGPSIRGIYNSGQISFLIDGNEFIDRLYSNVLFGNHFPVEQIERIEIIRGPGSVLYGGTAEMAVVNIITKKAKDLNGTSVSFVDGQMADTHARRNLNVLSGKQFRNDLGVYGSLFVADANRSDRIYTDSYGSSYNMKDFSEIDSLFLNAGMEYKNASLQWIVDRYAMEERDHYSVVIPEPTTNHFYSYTFDAKYEYKPTERWNIVPRFNFSRQIPWYIDNRDLNQQFATYYKAVCDRYTGSAIASYDWSRIKLLGGVEFYHDDIEFDKDSYNVNTATNLKQDYSDIAAFLQGGTQSSWGNLTLGARFENHSQFGSTFVPRISFTKLWEKFHWKALYSKAFRAPNIESIRFNASIQPETTRSLEFEVGYLVGKTAAFTANLFDVTVDDPILYVYENNRDNYYNFDKTGSRGVEAQYRFRNPHGDLAVTYSYYKAKDGSVPPYQPIDYSQGGILVSRDRFLGIPQHKVTAQASLNLTSKLTLNPTMIVFSDRLGYKTADAQGNLILETFDSTALLNLYFLWKDALHGLDFGWGIYDLFGTNYAFVASYNSGHAPLPGPTREFIVRVSYHF